MGTAWKSGWQDTHVQHLHPLLSRGDHLLDLLQGWRVLIASHGVSLMQVLQEVSSVLQHCQKPGWVASPAPCWAGGEYHVYRASERRRLWVRQSHQCFCWTDFSTIKCRCRDTATAKINDMEKAEWAYNGHWGNCFNSAPGSYHCGSESTLQNILLVNLPPCCGILSNYKHGPHLVYVGCSKSAAVMKGCHNKLLGLRKGRKKQSRPCRG